MTGSLQHTLICVYLRKHQGQICVESDLETEAVFMVAFCLANVAIKVNINSNNEPLEKSLRTKGLPNNLYF